MAVSNIANIRKYMDTHGGVGTANRYVLKIATPSILEQNTNSPKQNYPDSTNQAGNYLLEKKQVGRWNDRTRRLPSLTVTCDTAPLPGLSFQTSPIGDQGPEKAYPYAPSYEDLELSFVCSESMRERIFFDAWFESICLVTENNIPKFTWRNDYVTTITMDKLDKNDNVTYSLNLLEAYPITMSDQEMGYDQNEALKLSITFNYSRWIYNDVTE